MRMTDRPSASSVLTALFALAALSVSTALAQSPSVTIYNDGRVLMRRSVEATVKKGESTVTVAPGPIDPSTLFSTDPAVVITGADYTEAGSADMALRRAIGREIRWAREKDTVRTTVLGVDPLRLRLPDGSVIFTGPGLPLFPAELAGGPSELTLYLKSEAARSSLPLAWFTGGASWQASYQVILQGKEARVTGSAVIPSNGLDVANAQVQLLAGAVSRAAPAPAAREFANAQAGMIAMDKARGFAEEERTGEFHLYTIPGTLTIQPGQTTTAALFDPARVPYQKRYVVSGVLPIYGMVPQMGDEEQEVPVEVTYVLTRPESSAFGKLPLPGGVARLYEADSQGRLQLVGESGMGHTAAGQDVRLYAGNAFDLTARRVQTSYEQSHPTRTETQVLAAYRVTVANATDSAVSVDVLEQRRGGWTVLESSVPAEKVSSSTMRFRITVPAKGETVLTYRIRASW